MLRITKETDYSIMLMAQFAERPLGTIYNAREVAERVGVPLPMVSKILRSLAREDILTSHRGASGGYSLTRPASETSVARIIRAIEGPISLVQCGSEPGVCGQESSCPTRVTWFRINQEIEQALERVPVSEMLATHDCDRPRNILQQLT